MSFPLTTSWTTQCYARIHTPSTDTTLTFSSSGSLATSYLIDDVTVDQDALAPVLLPGGGLSP